MIRDNIESDIRITGNEPSYNFLEGFAGELVFNKALYPPILF